MKLLIINIFFTILVLVLYNFINLDDSLNISEILFIIFLNMGLIAGNPEVVIYLLKVLFFII